VQDGRFELTWEQALFFARSPRSFQSTERFWSLLRGVTLWTLWVARNEEVFNQYSWHRTKIELIIWQGLVDYGRGDWAKAVALIRKDLDKSEKALVRFDEDWGQYETICKREGMRVTWVTMVPTGIG
jgi:hypothetical protein